MSEATHNWPLIWEHLDTFLRINHAEQLAFWARCHGQDCKRAIEAKDREIAALKAELKNAYTVSREENEWSV